MLEDEKTALDWKRESAAWPNSAFSRFVKAGDIVWHVQVMGSGPIIVLIHGTAASTHSWRDISPILAKTHKVVAMDLPGHGFTSAPRSRDYSLPAMADAVGLLLDALELSPSIIVGHSAGAAVATRLSLDRAFGSAHRLVSFNGAFIPYGGAAAPILGPIARLVAWNPILPSLFVRCAASDAAVNRVIEGTGSKLNATSLGLYAKLFRSRRHVQSALAMMAAWDLRPLLRDLPRLVAPLHLVASSGDLAVDPECAFTVRDRVPGARMTLLRGLGHLAHEERPDEASALILDPRTPL